ncbi:MAG: choice-of-anchor Q domain-containing protein, partial [Geobacteraceae bacterium]|nr:choice-of-anchor Q domain-containing protein [Geobacteraceae bacterium]
APSNTRNVRLSFSNGGYYTFSHLNFKASRYVYNGNKDYSVDLGVGGPSWWGSAPSMATAPTLDDPSYSPNMTMGDNNGYNGFIVEYCNITGSIGLYGHNNIIRYCNLEGNETFTNGIYNSSIVCHHNLYTHNAIHGYVNRSIWLLDNINFDVISYNIFSNDAITADHVGPDIDCVPEPGHNNTIVGNVSFNMHRGIEFENQFNGTIEGNIVYNVTDYGIGIVAYGADQGVSTEYRSYDQKNIVRNNIVYNSNNAISTISSRGNYIVNNTVDGNNASQGAINIGNNGTAFAGNNTYIANNIITNNRIGLTNQSATGLTIINNLFYGNTSNGSVGSSYQTGNPLFIDRANYDFNIQAASPAIDKGTTPIITVSTDFTGTTTRPQGAAYDIGAYEYGATTTIALLPPPTNLRVQ